MISALFSFLGGSAFRMVWGEVSHWLTQRQDHKQELEMMRLQGELDAAQHARNQDAIKLQADLGVREIAVRSEADLSRIDAEGFYAASREATKPTGYGVVDIWNGLVRPICATIAVMLWVFALNEAGWKMGEWDKELVGAILGFYFASRELTKRGK